MAEHIKWNLADLYSGPDDPGINQALETATSRAQTLAKQWRGKISNSLKATDLLDILREYEAIIQLVAQPVDYAYLLFSAASTEAHGAFLHRLKQRATTVRHELLFIELALAQLSGATWRRWLGDRRLKNYFNYLQQQRAWKPHRLPEAEEKLMADKALTGRDAFARLFDEEAAGRLYSAAVGGKKRDYTEAELLSYLYHPRRAWRRQAAEALSAGWQATVRRVAYIFNMLAADKKLDDRYRQYPTPESERHIENQIDRVSVDALVNTVVASYSLPQTYYRMKRRLLGLKDFYDYDRYAPIGTADTLYSFAEAREVVLAAFTAFSPYYAAAAERFFSEGWIDATPRPGKQPGAYCAYLTPEAHPYIFINYTGTINDVLTLAHELGHGVHALLAQQQTYFNFNWPLTVAETASVFGEMLVFDHLEATLKKPTERLALLMTLLDRITSTVFRQIALYRFERRFHQGVHDHGELPVATINKLWRETQQELFGRAVTATSNYDVWWSYIPHFVRTPFYVYAYAFGELLTLALYARYQKDKSVFVERYLKLLATGGAHSPRELLQPMGIDLHDPAFWQEGTQLIADLVKEAQRLSKSGSYLYIPWRWPILAITTIFSCTLTL